MEARPASFEGAAVAPHLPYPKAIYLDGDLSKATITVKDAEAEALAQADGYFAWQPPQDEPEPVAGEVPDDDASEAAPTGKRRGGRRKKDA